MARTGNHPGKSLKRKTIIRARESETATLPGSGGRWYLSAVTVCFFLSGIAGLGYEVLWVRLLDKVIGSAPFAVATVITVIMAGLGTGSWLAGRFVSNQSSPRALLTLYAKLEMAIGACALAIPAVLETGTPVFRVLYAVLINRFWLYQFATFSGCCLLLIMPAVFMGATLPILCRFFVSDPERVGSGSGWIYGLNTLGAAVGSILCGFFLIRLWGVTATLYLFITINFSVGVVCLLMARKFSNKVRKIKVIQVPSASHINSKPVPKHWILIIFAVTGCCSMAYEVLWMRLLSLLIGPTTYSFTLVVTTFILGLALGSIIFARISDNSTNPWRLLLASQLGAVVCALVTSQLLGTSQFFFAKLIYHFHGELRQLFMIQTVILTLLILPATIFLGAAFPLVNKLCIRSQDNLVRSLGTAYSVNTAGSIVGSLAAGFLLIPSIGMEHGLRLVISLQAAIVFLASILPRGTVVPLSWKKSFIRTGMVVSGILAACLIGTSFFFPAWPSEQFSRGWYRNFHSFESVLKRTGWFEALTAGTHRIANQRQGLKVVYQGEGIAGFTTVEKEVTSLGTTEYALFNSGKADASSHGDRSTQALSAHIPMLFHPHAEEVMVLGMASGMTAGECLLYPLKRLDIVEINTKVLEAAQRFFSPWNNNCLHDPRSRVLVQDGRNHLALTDDSYDVIISEPSNPWMAGLANLFSREFFTLAKARLKPGGVFAQWIQAYEMDWQMFSLLGRTFSSVFPNSAMVKVGPVDYLLLGYANDRMDRQFFDWSIARANHRFARQSKNITLPGTEFLVHLILTENLTSLFGDGPLHTDNHPFLEYQAPLRLNTATLNIDTLVAPHRQLQSTTQQFLKAHNTIDKYLDLIEFSASAGVPVFNLFSLDNLDKNRQIRYRGIVMDYCRQSLLPSYSLISDLRLRTACATSQATAIREKLEKGVGTTIDRYNLAVADISAGNHEQAITELEMLVSSDEENESALTALGLLLAQHGNTERAEEIFTRLAELSPENSNVKKWRTILQSEISD